MLPVLLLALATVPADPCAQVEPAPEPNPKEAAAYLDVARAELSAGERDTAVSAFQEALRRQPDNAEAMAGLKSLCGALQAEGPLAAGTEAMKAKRFREALGPLSEAYASNPAPGTALLLAIAHYELRHEIDARFYLDEARKDPEFAEEAAFYQGLLAYHAGKAQEATALFQMARTDPRLAPAAGELLELARQDGPLVLSALAQTLYDSNPGLAPDGTPHAGAGGDGAADVTVLARLALPGTFSPFLRASGEYRRQLQLTAYDFGALDAAAGVELGGNDAYAVAEYAYDFLALGGQPYLSAHRLLASGRLRAGAFSFGLAYAARREDFIVSEGVPYSGWRHTARLEVSWRGPSTLVLTAGYQAAHHFAAVPELSYLEHGPALEARLRPLSRLSLAASLGLLLRDYDDVDPDLGVRRSDVYVDAEVFAELSLTDRLALQLAVNGRRALSNVDALTYAKLSCALRLSYAVGLP